MIKKIIITLTLAVSLIPNYAATTPARDAARKKWDAMSAAERNKTHEQQKIYLIAQALPDRMHSLQVEFPTLSPQDTAIMAREELQRELEEEETVDCLVHVLSQDPILDYANAVEIVAGATPERRQLWLDEYKQEMRSINQFITLGAPIMSQGRQLTPIKKLVMMAVLHNPTLASIEEALLLVQNATSMQCQQWLDEYVQLENQSNNLLQAHMNVVKHRQKDPEEEHLLFKIILMQNPTWSYQQAKLKIMNATPEERQQWINSYYEAYKEAYREYEISVQEEYERLQRLISTVHSYQKMLKKADIVANIALCTAAACAATIWYNATADNPILNAAKTAAATVVRSAFNYLFS